MMGPAFRRFGYAAALALSIAPGSQAEVRISPAELKKAAVLSLQGNDPARAVVFAEALLQRDEQDRTAHLIRASGLRQMGQYAPAQTSARQAWRLSETDAEKFTAARVMAQTLSSDGKRSRAQLWLRRAVHHAPSVRHEHRARRDFAHVRQQNPWSTHLSFTLAPNSNINNGSANDRSLLNYKISEILFGEPVEFALDGAAQALSGLEFGASVQTRYRFHQTHDTAHDLKFSASYRSFMLSGSSKDQAPGVEGSDFAYGTVGIGYGYRRLNLERKGEFMFDLDAVQSWYGGARYATALRGTVAQTYKPNRETNLRFSFQAEHQVGQRTSDVDTYRLTASMNKRLASGNLAFVKLGLATTSSPTADSEYREVELRGGYVLGKPVMGAAIQLGLGASLRDYDVSRHSADGREDLKITADITATFTQIDYYGFNPSVSLSASTTSSNIGLYDSNRVGLSIGIRSAF